MSLIGAPAIVGAGSHVKTQQRERHAEIHKNPTGFDTYGNSGSLVHRALLKRMDRARSSGG